MDRIETEFARQYAEYTRYHSRPGESLFLADSCLNLLNFQRLLYGRSINPQAGHS